MPETARIMQEQLQAPASVNVIVPYVRKMLPSGHRIGKVGTANHSFIFQAAFSRKSMEDPMFLTNHFQHLWVFVLCSRL